MTLFSYKTVNVKDPFEWGAENIHLKGISVCPVKL